VRVDGTLTVAVTAAAFADTAEIDISQLVASASQSPLASTSTEAASILMPWPM
jgi:hypothetical protein